MNQKDEKDTSKRTQRRAGYVVAIGVNVALLVIANNLLDWGWFSWITEDLDRVIPLINASLIAAIVVNVGYLAFDPPWFRSAGELVQLVFSLIATIRILQVFPFDFSAYEFGWGTLTRWLLGAAIFGVSVAMIYHLTRLARMARELSDSADAASAARPSEPDTG